MKKLQFVLSLLVILCLCIPMFSRIISGSVNNDNSFAGYELSDINGDLAAHEDRIYSTRDELTDSTQKQNSLGNRTPDANTYLRFIWDKLISVKDQMEKVAGQTEDILHRMHVVDCSFLQYGSTSGVYKIHVDQNIGHPIECFCDLNTLGGGWTVIMNRIAHLTMEESLNFTRPMRDYKIGFGSPNGDFWIGLETIHRLSKLRNYELLIELENFEGNKSLARYENFYIEGEDSGYRLHVSGYSGDAGDSLTNWGRLDNFTADGMMFSTFDQDRDLSPEFNCAKDWDIGGWWYNRCSWANLMGPYRLPGTGTGIGINWHKWQNKMYMRTARMMIRPRQG